MTRSYWIGGVLALTLASSASAQVVQPFFGGAGAFAPQISVVTSGTLLDAQAVVSADREYVTMNLRPSLSRLIALQSFNINNGVILPQQGFPGGVNPAGTGGAAVIAAGQVNSAAAIERRAKAAASILNQRGMTRLE